MAVEHRAVGMWHVTVVPENVEGGAGDERSGRDVEGADIAGK